MRGQHGWAVSHLPSAVTEEETQAASVWEGMGAETSPGTGQEIQTLKRKETQAWLQPQEVIEPLKVGPEWGLYKRSDRGTALHRPDLGGGR